MNNVIFSPDENIALIIYNDKNCDNDYNDYCSTPDSRKVEDTPLTTPTNKLLIKSIIKFTRKIIEKIKQTRLLAVYSHLDVK